VSTCQERLITAVIARATESSSISVGTAESSRTSSGSKSSTSGRTVFVLHPSAGSEAIEALYHPFSAVRAALNGKRWEA